MGGIQLRWQIGTLILQIKSVWIDFWDIRYDTIWKWDMEVYNDLSVKYSLDIIWKLLSHFHKIMSLNTDVVC